LRSYYTASIVIFVLVAFAIAVVLVILLLLLQLYYYCCCCCYCAALCAICRICVPSLTETSLCCAYLYLRPSVTWIVSIIQSVC